MTDQVTDREDRVRQRAAYETWDPQEVFDATIRKDLEEKFSYVYPYGYLQEIPAKVSVSELKKQGREEPEEETVYLYAEKEQEPIIPDFMKEEQEPLLQGAARGTVYHRILECLDYARVDSQQAIEKQMEELLKETGDKQLLRLVRLYAMFPVKILARYIAMQLHRTKHRKVVQLLQQQVRQVAKCYPERKFSGKEEKKFREQRKRAQDCAREWEEKGYRVDIYREEPFMVSRDSVEGKYYVMIWKKGFRNQKVKIEEIL